LYVPRRTCSSVGDSNAIATTTTTTIAAAAAAAAAAVVSQVISAGIVPSLLQLIFSTHSEVQQQAVQCIGAIASHNYEPMILLHENKALVALTSV
jgi:hypothetical protein